MPYKIIYDQHACIGAGECVSLSKLWTVDNRGKAVLSGAKETAKGKFELTIADDAYQKEMKAATSCPVGAIIIKKVQ